MRPATYLVPKQKYPTRDAMIEYGILLGLAVALWLAYEVGLWLNASSTPTPFDRFAF